MNSKRKELIALATFMPEPALWTAYVVLKTVREIYDAGEGERAELNPQQAEMANVIDIRSARRVIDIRSARRLERDPAPAKQKRETHEATSSQPDAETDDVLRHRIEEAQERLDRLGDQISRAAAKGYPTAAAEELFSTFMQSLSLMRTFDRNMASHKAHAVST